MRHGLFLSLAIGLSLVAGTSDAAGPTTDEAEARFAEGLKLMNARKYDQARVKFLQTYLLVTSTSNGTFFLGLCEIKSGSIKPQYYADGLRHVRQYLHLQREEQARKNKSQPDPDDAKHIQQATSELIPEALAHVADLTIETSDAALVKIDGRDVSLDDKTSARAPFPYAIPVTPGRHQIEAHVGAERASKEIDAVAGAPLTVSITIQSASKAPLAGATDVTSGVPVAPPNDGGAPPPGPNGPAEREPNPTRYWVAGGLGVAALALLGTGMYFGSQSKSAADDAERIRNTIPDGACGDPAAPGCSDLKDARDSQNRNQTISLVTYGLAGAAAVGAVVSLFVISKDRPAPRSTAAPLIGPGTVGAQWTTSF